MEDYTYWFGSFCGTDITCCGSLYPRPAAPARTRADDIQALMLPYLVNDVDTLITSRSRGRIWFETVYTDYTPSTGLIGPDTDAARFLGGLSQPWTAGWRTGAE